MRFFFFFLVSCHLCNAKAKASDIGPETKNIGGAKYLPMIFKWPFESLQQSISKQRDLFKKNICVICLPLLVYFILFCCSTMFTP